MSFRHVVDSPSCEGLVYSRLGCAEVRVLAFTVDLEGSMFGPAPDFFSSAFGSIFFFRLAAGPVRPRERYFSLLFSITAMR